MHRGRSAYKTVKGKSDEGDLTSSNLPIRSPAARTSVRTPSEDGSSLERADAWCAEAVASSALTDLISSSWATVTTSAYIRYQIRQLLSDCLDALVARKKDSRAFSIPFFSSSFSLFQSSTKPRIASPLSLVDLSVSPIASRKDVIIS
jgi:hypothetical protein